MDVAWVPKDGGIAVTVTGPRDAFLLVLAGPPTGPLVQPRAPRAWVTVGMRPDGQSPEILRVPFDDSGVARAAVPPAHLPPEGTLLQALAIRRDATGHPIAVSGCVSVTWRDGIPDIRPHGLEVLLSPAGAIWVAVAAFAAACVALRRLRIHAGASRALGMATVWLVAAFLVLGRVLAPAEADRPRDGEPFPPFAPEPLPAWRQGLNPVDRVTVPGLFDLVEEARAHIPRDAYVRILPASASGPAHRDAWEAAWLLWPREAAVLPPGSDPFAARGFHLLLGEEPPAGGAVLFRNRAGAVVRVDEGEPR
jgi:hypothetical protein